VKWGSIVLSNIIKGGYKGKVYPINPEAEKIQGLKSYTDIKKVPLEIDLSIIAIPAISARIPDVFEDCGEKIEGMEEELITNPTPETIKLRRM